MSNNYDNLEEINEKIKNKTSSTDKDKELLMYRLNKLLTEEEHLYIFTEILQNLDKRIYSITENCTLFSLNDLPNDAFWKIYYYSQLSIRNHERQKELDTKKQQSEQDEGKFKENMEKQLAKYRNDVSETSSEGLSVYEKLRVDALSECSYSTYSKNNSNSDYNMTLPDDKKMAKTIYSDTFKHRWKQNAAHEKVIGGIEKNQVKKEIDNELQSVGASVMSEIGEDDEDDMMLNENYEDVDSGNEKAELDKLKNQLLKLPKMKLTLKVTPLNYEDDDD